MKKVAIVGSFVVDLMARMPHLPEAGETVKGSYFQLGPGGKGSNQAIAAKRAGAELLFSTKLGKDSFAELARNLYQADGISEAYVFETEEAATGAALIGVDEKSGQNEICVVLGACETYTSEEIEQISKALNACTYLLMQLEINMDAVQSLAAIAKEKGISVVLNPAPVQEIADDLYQGLYMITPNEVEAKILTGISCDTKEGCRKAAQFFIEKGVKKVIITLGERGVFVADDKDGVFLENNVVKALDTTGAGDAFNGGLLAGLSQEMTLLSAVRYGIVVANLAVTKIGTASSMPKQEEITQFIREQHIAI